MCRLVRRISVAAESSRPVVTKEGHMINNRLMMWTFEYMNMDNGHWRSGCPVSRPKRPVIYSLTQSSTDVAIHLNFAQTDLHGLKRNADLADCVATTCSGNGKIKSESTHSRSQSMGGENRKKKRVPFKMPHNRCVNWLNSRVHIPHISSRSTELRTVGTSSIDPHNGE